MHIYKEICLAPSKFPQMPEQPLLSYCFFLPSKLLSSVSPTRIHLGVGLVTETHQWVYVRA